MCLSNDQRSPRWIELGRYGSVSLIRSLTKCSLGWGIASMMISCGAMCPGRKHLPQEEFQGSHRNPLRHWCADDQGPQVGANPHSDAHRAFADDVVVSQELRSHRSCLLLLRAWIRRRRFAHMCGVHANIARRMRRPKRNRHLLSFFRAGVAY